MRSLAKNRPYTKNGILSANAFDANHIDWHREIQSNKPIFISRFLDLFEEVRDFLAGVLRGVNQTLVRFSVPAATSLPASAAAVPSKSERRGRPQPAGPHGRHSRSAQAEQFLHYGSDCQGG
jgi:hypothetical protein